MILKKSCQFLALFLCLWAFNTGFVQQDPEHVIAILGEDVTLHCAFDFPEGVPVPYVIQWQKQGIKIPIYIWYDGYPPHAGEGYEGRVSLADQASLNMTDVRETDQGWYECKVYFLNRPPDSPKNGTWVHLDVHAPPHFKMKPPEVVYVKVGESVSLPCEAEGTPIPAIIWYKDNMPLEETLAIHIMPTELRISKLKTTDIGDYLCMARNREGSVTSVSKVIVAGPAVITVPPRNITKLEGDKAEFICEAKALPSNVTHRWFHNGVEISQLSWLETRTLVRRDGTLFINPTSAEDSGRYTCEVTNGIGNPETASAYLSVEYPARVTYSPTIQYLPLGLAGIIRCYVQASPNFQFITWTKDRRPFDPNATPGVVTLNNGSLLFQLVNLDHQGRYRCTPYNIHGTAGTSNVMEVLVREPPMFTIKPKETYQASVNGEVKMPCDGNGQPKPTLSWRRADGEKLPRDRYIQRGGNLTIKGITKEDHGHYECVLENEIATLVTSTLLLVESTTPHAPTNVSVNTSAFAATLNWLPAYDGGYEQSYVVWYRLAEQGDSEWRTIKVQPVGSTAITLFNLQPDAEYEFQVLSRNVLGDGLFSQIIRARTKTWDYSVGVYPTDPYGSTYIPTIVKPTGTEPSTPAGPKPWPPLNVTVKKTKDGVLVTWQPPHNQSVPVAYYYVDYRTADTPWERFGPIEHDNKYLAKNLPGGMTYNFRVYSYSIMSVGTPSAEVKLEIQGQNPEQNKSKAITAGVVGGILFFIAAIVLSVCAVKICNKRKRRKAEKAYMMVTCPVADARNGGHSHGGSPVPLKKYQESRVPGIATAMPAFGLVHRVIRLLRPPSRHVVTTLTDSAEWPRGRRFPKAVRYSVEMEYSRPLGWISRAADGKFDLRNSNHPIDDEVPHFIPSSHHPGIRGSLRSEGSGLSSPSSRQQVSFSLASQPIPSVYSSPPRDPRFRTSSPGPVFGGTTFVLAEDLSSVNQPSSAERSFPSTVSSHFASLQNSGGTVPSSYVELPPTSRTLQHNPPSFYHRSRQFRPIVCQADVHAHPSAEAGPQTPRRPPLPGRPQIRVGADSRLWRDGRHIHLPGHHPTRRLEVPRVSAIQKAAMSPRQVEVYHRLQSTIGGWSEGTRPLATSSPPRLDRRVARVPPSPATKPTTETTTTPKVTAMGEEGSDETEHPVTYTRDRLLGAVERVRSSALHRGGPFRHSAPELEATARERTPCATPSEEIRPPSAVEATDDPFRAWSRASITSGSSGRGSSGQGSKVSHSRGDSLQGELLEIAGSSSSGFLSRNSSGGLTTTSRHDGGGALVRTTPQQLEVEDSSPAHRTASHHDISVDENYEFDSVSPFDSEMLDPRLRPYQQVDSTSLQCGGGGLSDSELYGSLFPRPQKRSQYDNTEKRCEALKQEFLRFRRQQRKEEVLESAC